MRLAHLFVLVVGLSAATPAAAQFRNMGVQFNVGYLSLGTLTDDFYLNNTAGFINPWNVHDHATIGAGYFIFVGYHLRLDSQVVVGGGCDRYGAACTPVYSVQVSQGGRYMFLNEKHRPFVSAHIQYLHLIPGGVVNGGDPDLVLPGNFFLQGAPFWVGVRAGGGYEWIFLEEQGLEFEVGLTGLVGFFQGNFVRPSAVARFGWNVYF